MPPSAKILFLTGNPKEKLLRALTRDGFNVIAVVVPDSGKFRPRYQGVVDEASASAIPVVTAPIRDLDSAIGHLEYDLLLSCGYPFKIPESACGKAKLAVNFHPALLPRHRGRYLHYILLDRDERSGVTAHKIDPGYDTGPIIKQAAFKVSPFDTVKSLTRKSDELEIGLVKEVIRLFEAGRIELAPQDDGRASSHFEKRTPEDSEIDPSKPLAELFYEIRAYDPELYPAFFYVDGQKVYVRVCRKDKPADESDMI